MFSPGNVSPQNARVNSSGGRRPIGSPGPTRTGSRVVRTPNHAQLVQLESAGEFGRREPDENDLDESLSEDIPDDTVRATPPEQPTPIGTPPPQRQTTQQPPSSADASRSITPVTPVMQNAPGIPGAAGAGAASGTSTPGQATASKPRSRPQTLSTAAVESPASPDFDESQEEVRRPVQQKQQPPPPPPPPAEDAPANANPGPKTMPADSRRQHVNINAETPAAQRAHAKAVQQAAAAAPTTPPRITLGNKQLIGSGSFGTVYRALDMTNNRSIAVKEVRLQHLENPTKAKKEIETLEREIKVMGKLSHPNIVKYLGSTRGEGTFNILMEYVSCGTVGSLLKTFGPLQPIQAALFTKQILAGLEYLHSKRIAHRDLKGDNLFVDVDGTLKLGDFGTAKELQTIKSTAFNSVAGTPYFMAPEVVKNGGHGLEADIWSVGCCVIQMVSGQPPYRNFDTQMAVMFQVVKGDIASQIPKDCQPDTRDFILSCCKVEPKERPTVSELLQHPWLTSAPPAPTAGSSGVDSVPVAEAAAPQAAPRSTPPRPAGSGARKVASRDGAVKSGPGSRSTSTSPPPRPTSGRDTGGSASRGVAAARQLRKQSDRPGGPSAVGSRRTATPTRAAH